MYILYVYVNNQREDVTMNEQILIGNEIQSIYKLNDLYKPKAEKDIICILCEGSHGNNTLCQMSWEGNHEVC